MENFTPWTSLAGGALIGLAATVLLVFNGRVAGISGIFAGAMLPHEGGRTWRVAFVGGLMVGGAAFFAARPALFVVSHGRSLAAIALAGLLVGVGVRMGGGCTSGHGVCGNSRLSTRSMIATPTFILAGALTVLVVRALGGT